MTSCNKHNVDGTPERDCPDCELAQGLTPEDWDKVTSPAQQIAALEAKIKGMEYGQCGCLGGNGDPYEFLVLIDCEECGTPAAECAKMEVRSCCFDCRYRGPLHVAS